MDEKRARYLLDFAEGQGLLDRRGGFTHYEPDMADYRKLMDDLKPYISKRGAIFVFTDRKQSFLPVKIPWTDGGLRYLRGLRHGKGASPSGFRPGFRRGLRFPHCRG